MSKKWIGLGAFVGSIAGSYLPALFGENGMMISIIFGAIGGIAGIYAGYRISR